MAEDKRSGGFHFGSVGGGVNVTAGGDIVGRDKTTTTTTMKGFADDENKEQFQADVDQLREALRAIKVEIEASALNDDAKDEAVSEILQTVKALKEAKEKTAEVAPKQEAPAHVADVVEGALDRAGGMIDMLQSLATKTGEVTETVGKFAVQYGPVLLSARHLFGLP